jgi:hypothetical protein
VDENIIETEQIEDGHVVLAIPSLRLIVMGRTLDEARAWARAALEHRGQTAATRAEPSTTTDDELQPPGSNAA